MSKRIESEIAIIGSGFSGSLLAWILARAGRDVVLLDRSKHPRFAIGESSTPIADLLLEQIADEFGIAPVRSLSRWGTWQRDLPHLRAGLKRGFSYFSHTKNEPFKDNGSNDASLLVAASANDDLSDTHWMRSDVDHWLFQQAVAAGAQTIELFEDIRVDRQAGRWAIRGQVVGQPKEIACRMIVDASGSGTVLGSAFELKPLDDTLQVRTAALFGHFRNVQPMTRWLQQHGLTSDCNPFDADDAAQHHMLGDGWMWMLRFSEDTTSVGVVRPMERWKSDLDSAGGDRQAAWARFLAQYPTLSDLLTSATLLAPQSDTKPCLGWIPRISRCLHQAAGHEWAMLPSSVGIIDPLHSTGIAHSIHGIRRLARLILADTRFDTSNAPDSWESYSGDIVAEIQWIDRIVACCYGAAVDSFQLFSAACSLYFIAAIHSERHLANAQDLPDGFLLHKNTELRELVSWAESAIQRVLSADDRSAARRTEIDILRLKLAPWNDVGLLDPALHNRITHSAAPKH